jgi:hypothetical protein
VGAAVTSFNDADATATAGDFTAMIDWGDGTTACLGVVFQPGGAGAAFVVAGNHTYAVDRAVPYPITVTIRDRGGAEVTTVSQATVADVAPLVSGIPVKMTKHLLFSAPIAYITEVPGAAPEPVGHYTATIDWGDHTSPTAGMVEAVPGGAWVVGTHPYADVGPFTVTVIVTDDSGATVSTTATSYDPPAGSSRRAVGRHSTPVGVPAGPLHHVRPRPHDPAHRGRIERVGDQAHRPARAVRANGKPLRRRAGMPDERA